MDEEQFGKAMKQETRGLVLQLLPPDAFCISTLEIDPFLTKLLDQFQVVFSEPTGLPPNRDQNHNIFLQPGAKPICVGHIDTLIFKKLRLKNLFMTCLF